MNIPRITSKSTSFKPRYPFAVELADKQLDMMWLAKDYNMSDDAHDFRVKATKAQRMMIIQTQKIFNHYEVKLGTDFWNGRFKQIFKGYEFERLGSVFGMVETAVHSPFYIQMTDVVGLNDEDFHNTVFHDPELKSRIEFIVNALTGPCDLRSLAAMTFLEGTALFASLAALMSFRKPGEANIMKNMVSGIVHSCSDELLHCFGSAKCFQELLKESSLSPTALKNLQKDVNQLAKDIVEHEAVLIRKLFQWGELGMVTELELAQFVMHRADECLTLLGYDKYFKPDNNPIGDWIYLLVESYNFGDFFQTTQKDYTKYVNKEDFTW